MNRRIIDGKRIFRIQAKDDRGGLRVTVDHRWAAANNVGPGTTVQQFTNADGDLIIKVVKVEDAMVEGLVDLISKHGKEEK